MEQVAKELARRFELILDHEARSLPMTFPSSQGVLVISGASGGAQVVPYLTILRRELERYPGAFLASVRLKRIVLAKLVSVDEEPRPGVPVVVASSHRVSTSPVSMNAGDDNTLVLDVGYVEDARYAIHVIHHEVWHVVEGATNPDILWIGGHRGRYDPRVCYEPPGSLMAARPIGFVSPYSATNEWEDRAETFAYMMACNEELEAISRTDVTVKLKSHHLRHWLVQRFPDIESSLFQGGGRPK